MRPALGLKVLLLSLTLTAWVLNDSWFTCPWGRQIVRMPWDAQKLLPPALTPVSVFLPPQAVVGRKGALEGSTQHLTRRCSVNTFWMVGWMGGWWDGGMDGWMGGWLDGWMD